MSQYTVYIKVPDYLNQWCRHEFWNPDTKRVEFPRGSAPRVILQTLLSRAPRPSLAYHDHSGELPVEVPTFKGINPKCYNHLPEAGKKALVSCLKKYFSSVMWQELHPLLNQDIQITDVVYAFLDRHGIEPTPQNWETVRQMYYRMRKRTAKDDIVKER